MGGVARARGVMLLVLAGALGSGCGPGDAGAGDAGADAEDAGGGVDAAWAPSRDGGLGVDDAGGGRDAPEPAADVGPGRLEAIEASLASCDPDRFDRALRDVAWAEGWPLHVGTRWVFATRLEDAEASASLVGDIDGWDTERWPATRCPDGRRYVVLLDDAALEAPAEGSKYKWFIAAARRYLAPMEATAYGFDAYGRFGWVRAPAGEHRLEQFPELTSRFLEARRAVRVYLPAGFVARSEAASRMRTLLLHDGQNVFHPDAAFGGWRVDEALAARGDDVVAVAVDNAIDRMDAYTHVEDDIGRGPVGGRADDYLALLRDEVLPFVRERYGIVARGRSLMIAGSSLGGLVTLVAASHDLESIGCGAALSSTLGWGSIAASAARGRTLIETWGGVHAALYLDSGGGVRGRCEDLDGDGIEDDAGDSDNYCVTAQMRRVLERAGYVSGANLRYAWAEGASHDEAAWAARIGGALDACRAMGWSAP